MHQTQFSEKIPYGGLSQIRSQICKLRFYYGYTEKDENDETIRIYYHNAQKKYFQLSSFSLYEKSSYKILLTTLFSVPAPLNQELMFIEQTTSW